MSLLLPFLNFIVTLFLTGLIWFVQVVHYPIFRKVAEGYFLPFHHFHTTATGKIVALPMLAELLLSIACCFIVTPFPKWFWWLLLLCTFALWAITFGFFVPLHAELAAEKNVGAIEKLVNWNWLRTALWTLRAVLLAIYFYYLIRNPFN